MYHRDFTISSYERFDKIDDTYIRAYADLATENAKNFEYCYMWLWIITYYKSYSALKIENFGLVRNQEVNSFYSSFKTIFVGWVLKWRLS